MIAFGLRRADSARVRDSDRGLHQLFAAVARGRPSEGTLIAAHQIFSARIGTVEVLSGFAAESFAVTGDVKRDLLDITAVHPMRESEVVSYLERGGAREADLQRLVDGEELVRVLYRGEPFYIRKISRTEAPAGA